ncbi:MAG: O-antigen ligase family protein [Pirellulaceae bacterium]|nr:O-antigen ligase family protein [Pirellulaceae bacterium]
MAVVGLAAWWFSMVLGSNSTQRFPFLALPVILGLILVGLQTVPLSDDLASLVAPRQAELYEQYSSPVPGELLEDKQDPISVNARITMDIDGTTKMFNLLMLGLICLILGCYFFSSRRFVYLLPFAMTLNGVAISCYGIVQQLSGDLTIYGWEIADIVQPIGPFVNRNNAAGYLLMCLAGSLALLYGVFHAGRQAGKGPRVIVTREYPIWKRAGLHFGIFVAELNAQKLLAILATIIITTGILFTVSRGGFLALGVGCAIALFYYCVTRKSSFILIGITAALFLVLGALNFSETGDRLSQRLGRLSDTDIIDLDQRAQHWSQTAPAILEFSPLGSGLGSYLNVHRLYRVDDERRVYYFAENQYFQTLMETGIIGLLLLLSAILILAMCLRFLVNHGNSPKTASVCVLGIFLVPSQMVAAFFDFGWFIPANTILLATTSGFIAGQTHALADRLKNRSFFRFGLPRWAAFGLMLLIFSIALLSLISSWNYAAMERNLGETPQTENYDTMSLEKVDTRIEGLKQALQKVPEANGLLRLAELYLYRYRIQLFNAFLDNGDSIYDDKEAKKKIWNYSTGIDRLHRLVYQAWLAEDEGAIRKLIRDPLIRENILPAAYYLELSRARSPLNPAVHVLLGQTHTVSPTRDAELPHLQRASELAPANATIAFVCGILNLQAGRDEAACENLKKCLQISPRNYRKVVSVSLAYLPADRIANEILPDNVQLLYNFAENQMASKSLEPRRPELYRRIVALLEESQNRDRKSLVIKSEVQENLGDLQGAIKTQQLLVNNFRNIVGFKYRLTNLIFKRCEEIMERPEASQNWREELEERIDQAKEALDNLKRKDKNKEYQAEIRKALLRHKQITEKARQAGLNK